MGGMDGSAGVFKSEAVSESSSFLAVLFRMTARGMLALALPLALVPSRESVKVTEDGILWGKVQVLGAGSFSPLFGLRICTKTQQLKVIVVVEEELVIVVILETTTAVVVVVVTYSLILSVRHFFFVFLRVHVAEHVLG